MKDYLVTWVTPIADIGYIGKNSWYPRAAVKAKHSSFWNENILVKAGFSPQRNVAAYDVIEYLGGYAVAQQYTILYDDPITHFWGEVAFIPESETIVSTETRRVIIAPDKYQGEFNSRAFLLGNGWLKRNCLLTASGLDYSADHLPIYNEIDENVRAHQSERWRDHWVMLRKQLEERNGNS